MGSEQGRTGDGAVALVADDHDISRVALTSVLTQRLGFAQVLGTGSFEEALDILSGTPRVTLALFDLQMPGMAGPATLSAVREVFPATRVVMVTASTRREDVLEALAAGVHGYLPKTLRLDEIAGILQSVVAGAIYVPPLLAEPPPAGRGLITSTPPGQTLPLLTARQRDVLALLRRGKSNKEIARTLNLGSGTVKVHVSSILRVLRAPNRAAAVAIAAELEQDEAT